MGRVPKFASLSVFFPAYNDSPSLPPLLRDTFAVLEEHVADYEVIVVDDRSSDAKPSILARKSAAGGRLRVVRIDELPMTPARIVAWIDAAAAAEQSSVTP